MIYYNIFSVKIPSDLGILREYFQFKGVFTAKNNMLFGELKVL